MTETTHCLGWQDWANPIQQELYVIGNSRLHMPDRPGVGLEWNEDAVKANLAGL